MSLIVFALRRPFTVVVFVVAVVLGAVVALQRMPRDVFPPLNVPTIYVAQPYGGMDPAQMEGYLTYRYEYHFLYIAGIEHVESKSIQGATILKLQFHPGTDMAAAMSETVAQVNRSRAFMPPGTVAPFIMRFDAGSVAVGYLVFSTEDPSVTLSHMQDQALNRVRPMFATLPGVSAPPPFGGSSRSVVVRVDPQRMQAYGLSPDDIVKTLAQGNVVSPSGNINLEGKYPMIPVNAIPANPKDLETLAIKRTPQGAIFVRDVATVEDSADVTTSYALADGLRSVYLPVTKRADASTLAVVDLVRRNLPEFQKLLPEGIQVRYAFDQSPVVERSIQDLLREGALGALLTGLMVLLFLRDWRGAFLVVVNIPLSLLASSFALWLCGEGIHLMTLGGMALAVGILVDEATVTVENIHAHMARGASSARAALEGARETTQPRFLAMLCILAVFLPAFFMQGAAQALFVPLALAVGFSMTASFLLSSTLVPVLSVWVTRAEAAATSHSDPGWMRGLQAAYGKVLSPVVGARRPLVLGYLLLAATTVWLVGGRLGVEIFPHVDSGQFALRFRAAPGTQVETTEGIARKILATVARESGGADKVEVSIGMVGVHNSSFPVNLVHLWTGGPEEGWLAIQLAASTGLDIEEFKERLRAVLGREHPDVQLSFEPQDIVSRVMSFGSPTPLEVAIRAPSLAAGKLGAEKLLTAMRALPFLRDVQIAQTLDYPTVNVNVNRERAGLLGVRMEDVTRALVTATTSSRFTVANYWADPNSGISFNVQVQIPEEKTRSIEDLLNLPISSTGGETVPLRSIAEVTEATAVGTYERYNMARIVSLTANIHGMDLGTAAREVRRVVTEAELGADGRTKVDIRGQVVPLEQLMDGFRSGLVMTIVVVFLLLTANFQSPRLALAAISTVPAALAGVVLALWITGTTLNIQSAMGSIMSVGVAVANAILLVTFAEKARCSSATPTYGNPVAAAIFGAGSRLRPILMTSLAMIAGMIPLALGLGEGGDQTAPLGRSVVGGLSLATLATLFVVPSVLAMLAGGDVRSPSLDPDDAEGALYEGKK